MSGFSYKLVIRIWFLGLWWGIQAEQTIQLPKQTQEENLMLGLIEEFANLQNV